MYARLAPEVPKNKRFSRNDWKMLKIAQLECVSYGVVCGVSYCFDNEKALIGKDDCHERKHRVTLHTLIASWVPLNT